MEHESDGDTNCGRRTWDNPQSIGKGTRRIGNKWPVEIIQSAALLRSTRILRRVLETKGDLLSLKLQWETISVKKSRRSD